MGSHLSQYQSKEDQGRSRRFFAFTGTHGWLLSVILHSLIIFGLIYFTLPARVSSIVEVNSPSEEEEVVDSVEQVNIEPKTFAKFAEGDLTDFTDSTDLAARWEDALVHMAEWNPGDPLVSALEKL